MDLFIKPVMKAVLLYFKVITSLQVDPEPLR